MDIEKLIETLRQRGVAYVRAYGRYCSICDEVVTALSTLQAENEKLRADLARVTAERDGAIECLKNKCPFCRKYLTCQGRTINNDCWEFFGLKED